MCITRYYIVEADHTYAKSAELVHTKKSSLADSLVCSVTSQLSYRTYQLTYILVLEEKPSLP